MRTATSATLARPRLAAALTSIVEGVDPNLPITTIAPWQQIIAPVLFPARAATIALGILGLLALSLAITGIFGLASYSVSRRMRDFGIRLALGAPRQSILNTALGRVAAIVLIGCSLGLLLGLASTRILAAIVYGASANDPLVVCAVVLTMLATGILSAALARPPRPRHRARILIARGVMSASRRIVIPTGAVSRKRDRRSGEILLSPVWPQDECPTSRF